MLLRSAWAVLLIAGLGGLARGQEEPPPEKPKDPAAAGENEPHAQGAGHGSLGFQIGYYDNADSGDGNPFLDEELTVIEPAMIFSYNATDELSFNATLSYDDVSSASIERLSRFPEQSGASGDNYVGVDLAMGYKFSDDWRGGAHLHYSTEYDYDSLGFGANVATDLANKNATLSFDVTSFFDKIDVIRFNGMEEGTDNRSSLAFTTNWYQILSPTVHSELGLTLANQTGFLETAYNGVVFEDPSFAPNPFFMNNARGLEIAEELPNSRQRYALFGKVRKYLEGGTSLELGGRLYSDSWGITSITLEPRLYHWLVQDRLIGRVRYRYYSQTAADDYQDHFYGDPTAIPVPKNRTQDSDLADLSSHTLGLRFDWYVTANSRLGLSGDTVMRSDGIDQILLALSWTWTF
ncbi:MAG: DUF3570 domain-containing protein [Planctomycetota bacterium]